MQPSASPLRISWIIFNLHVEPQRFASVFKKRNCADRAASPADQTQRQADVEKALAHDSFEIGKIFGVDHSAVAAGAMSGKSRIGIERHGFGVIDAGAL